MQEAVEAVLCSHCSSFVWYLDLLLISLSLFVRLSVKHDKDPKYNGVSHCGVSSSVGFFKCLYLTMHIDLEIKTGTHQVDKDATKDTGQERRCRGCEGVYIMSLDFRREGHHFTNTQ